MVGREWERGSRVVGRVWDRGRREKDSRVGSGGPAAGCCGLHAEVVSETTSCYETACGSQGWAETCWAEMMT